MTPTTKLANDLTDLQTRMADAFALVDPGEQAAELAARGMISEEIAGLKSWRDRIVAVVLADDLAERGLTISDVVSAIEFFTATDARVEPADVKSLAWVSFLDSRPGFLVMADGYRMGPAGP